MFSKLALALTALFVVSTVTSDRADAVTPDDAREIARQAYIYGYAPIASYGTWYKQAVDTKAPEYVGGFNVLRSYSQPFTAANHDIVTPNHHTP